MPLRRRHRGQGPFRPRPGQPARAASPTQTAPQSGERPVPTPRRKTVLVIEDNATVGGLMVALLREEGYRALRAWDGREALRMARDRKPDLILLDLSLPYRDGLELLHDLKAHPETAAAPIMIVSGNALNLAPGDRELLAECISKPVDIDRLVNYARRHLGDPEHQIPDKDYSSTVDQNLHYW